ncbi:MAG: XdhC/CoxI family protein [Cyclobacteriaceae bacterium]
MKEIKEIIKAFELSVKSDEQVALATVVHVEGSSYRRPGARMLVTENGHLTGAISGGCLEGDALRKAQMVIFQKKSMLVTYDTTDDDDAKFGVGLGCNGIIHVLIEPIDPNQEHHPIALLNQCLANREDKILVTVYDLNNKRSEQKGTCILYPFQGQRIINEKAVLSEDLLTLLDRDAKEAFGSQKSSIVAYPGSSAVEAFIEMVQAPISLLLVGAGNDTLPLANIAEIMGWELSIVDGRSNLATSSRFPNAKQFHIGKPEEVIPDLKLDSRTAVVLMTHNFNYDLAILKGLLPLQMPYLGVLGPKKKLEIMLENLSQQGSILSEREMSRIFGPMGLNIGAEAPEEIALSIMAEIKAVVSGEKGTFLKDKKGPIHAAEKKLFLKD